MMPDHLVSTNSTFTPISLARREATSISKPTRLPALSLNTQGTNTSTPTFMTPRFMISSTRLSLACAPTRPAIATSATSARIHAFFISLPPSFL